MGTTPSKIKRQETIRGKQTTQFPQIPSFQFAFFFQCRYTKRAKEGPTSSNAIFLAQDIHHSQPRQAAR